MSKKFTPAQQNVIDYRGGDMLVSASAGTGKTTVMIERILSLIEQGADLRQFVVVTFTNLAAAEMKNRLAAKLAQKKDNPHVADQLDRLDGASICTLHSFCSELLRNYFYVVDIDPSFAILDEITVSTLRKNAMDQLFEHYFAQKDETFLKVYKIFAKRRNEENFKQVLWDLHNFSRCLEDFSAWYAAKRTNFTNYGKDNPIITTLLADIAQTVQYYKDSIAKLKADAEGENLPYGDVFQANLKKLDAICIIDLQQAMFDVAKLSLESLPSRSKKAADYQNEVAENIRNRFEEIKKGAKKFAEGYAALCNNQDVATLWAQTEASVAYTDKLVEMVLAYDGIFYDLKKQRGGLDFNDLEHLTLKLLAYKEASEAIRQRYRQVFVDEYQDTNPVQEAIVAALSQNSNLFMVGDIKQSIYGFRGCEPGIFLQKYRNYKQTGNGFVQELNDNFRSNRQILQFVNLLFEQIMTESFGKVNYKRDAALSGNCPPLLSAPSTQIDFVLKQKGEEYPITQVYDVTNLEDAQQGATAGAIIANRIKSYVGMAYKDADGANKRIGYGDIVILMRSLTGRAVEIYNALLEQNIPVVANFKVEGYANKEVRDIINLLRVVDNPYNDLFLVGVCLSCFGGFSEDELGVIRLDTAGRVPFYDRLKVYCQQQNNALARKTEKLLQFVQQVRFYSRSATVCEVVLKIMSLTNYHLHVEGLPNGALRLKKLYSFVDGLRGASYGQSVDKFLSYIDETEDKRADESPGEVNAVRLMTMHASKGLEFPIVIVAGVENTFRFDNHAVERNTDLGLATRHYDFGTMRVADSLGAKACGMFNKTKQREEEMRLLYVALTRAKHLLNIVAVTEEKQLKSLPKMPQAATCHLDWIHKVVAEKQLQLRQCGVVVNTIVETATATEQTKTVEMCQQHTDEQAVMAMLNYVYPYASQTTMPSKVVSSTLDKEFLGDDDQNDAPPVPLVDNANRQQLGTAYHKVYQYAPHTATVEQIDDTILALVADGKIEPQFADQLDRQLIFDTLHNPRLVELFNRGTVHHEIPFMLRAPHNQLVPNSPFTDKTMLQGVIDLLIIGNGKATVVDFKYTMASHKIADRYPLQLASYRLAVQQICGIADVDCYVLSIADNKLIRM